MQRMLIRIGGSDAEDAGVEDATRVEVAEGCSVNATEMMNMIREVLRRNVVGCIAILSDRVDQSNYGSAHPRRI